MAAKARNTDVQISKAFQDLDALMEMAKPMVALANKMSKRIREKKGDVSDDETIQFKSYLMSMVCFIHKLSVNSLKKIIQFYPKLMLHM